MASSNRNQQQDVKQSKEVELNNSIGELLRELGELNPTTKQIETACFMKLLAEADTTTGPAALENFKNQLQKTVNHLKAAQMAEPQPKPSTPPALAALPYQPSSPAPDAKRLADDDKTADYIRYRLELVTMRHQILNKQLDEFRAMQVTPTIIKRFETILTNAVEHAQNLAREEKCIPTNEVTQSLDSLCDPQGLSLSIFIEEEKHCRIVLAELQDLTHPAIDKFTYTLPVIGDKTNLKNNLQLRVAQSDCIQFGIAELTAVNNACSALTTKIASSPELRNNAKATGELEQRILKFKQNAVMLVNAALKSTNKETNAIKRLVAHNNTEINRDIDKAIAAAKTAVLADAKLTDFDDEPDAIELLNALIEKERKEAAANVRLTGSPANFFPTADQVPQSPLNNEPDALDLILNEAAQTPSPPCC